MSNPRAKDRLGATPGKLALIALLAVVLVGVIVGQFSDTPGPNDVVPQKVASSKTRPQEGAQHASASTSSIKPNQQTSKPQQWPRLSVEEASAFDPFSAIGPLAPPPIEAMQPIAEDEKEDSPAMEKLLQQKATIVVIADNDKVATIGTQQIHIGDVIEGYKITDITTQGIVLTKLEKQQTQ